MLTDLLADKIISSRKIEKLRKIIKKKEKERLRAELPVLNAKQIRSYRLPHNETVLADLSEAGHTNAVHFIHQLFELQHDVRMKHGEGTAIWQQPQLIHSDKELDVLAQGLARAEAAHRSARHDLEWDEMLKLSSHFGFGASEWWWVGEQLLVQCIAMDYPGKFRHQIAIANFLFGKFLVENLDKGELAREHLDKAREITLGNSWHCKAYLKQPDQDNLFIECCKLLSFIQLQEAKRLIKENPKAAVELCVQSRRYAVESCQEKMAFDALLFKGMCELTANNVHSAIGTLSQLLKSATKSGFVEEICAARTHLAVALLRHGKQQEALENLKLLGTLAEENNLHYYVGLAYRYIGEHFLADHNPRKATPFLCNAFYIFNRLGNCQLREEVRSLTAISAGQELFPYYIHIIKQCRRTTNLLKLLAWKDYRKMFWTEAQSKFSQTIEPCRKELTLTDNDSDNQTGSFLFSISDSTLDSIQESYFTSSTAD